MKQSKKSVLLLNTALIYAICGLIGGVFYREFTKYQNFSEHSHLAFLHVHLFSLGMLWFLIVMILDLQLNLVTCRGFFSFYSLYNVGLMITISTLTWRGISQVQQTSLSPNMDATLSGLAGFGHILIAISLILFFHLLRSTLINPPHTS